MNQEPGLPRPGFLSTCVDCCCDCRCDVISACDISKRNVAMGNFCAKGREIENSHTNHIFTKEELRVLEREESQDYLPSNSNVYRKWLRQYKSQNVDNGLDKWFLMGAVGVTVGFLGFLVKSATGFIVTNKYAFIAPYVEEADLTIIWAWLAGIGLLLALLSSVLVVCVAPEAAGSGIPEVIGFVTHARLSVMFAAVSVRVVALSCDCAESHPSTCELLSEDI